MRVVALIAIFDLNPTQHPSDGRALLH